MAAVTTLLFAGGSAVVLSVVTAVVAAVSAGRHRRICAERALADAEERATLASQPEIFGLSAGAGTEHDSAQQEVRGLERGSAPRRMTAPASVGSAAQRYPEAMGDLVDGRRLDAEPRKHRAQLIHLARVATLGKLCGALAHELQQPLTSISCNAEAADLLLQKQPIDVSGVREIIRDISIEHRHAGEVVQRIRALLFRGGVEYRAVRVAALLDNVLGVARSVLREQSIELHMRVAPEVHSVRGNQVELQQVLLNLVLNACDSMRGNEPRGRRLDVVASLEPTQGEVRVSVLDQGKGINPGQLEQIFEPFFTTKEDGVGLGLAISRSIIAAHGGRLWAMNRPEGGAAFHFTVSMSEEEQAQ